MLVIIEQIVAKEAELRELEAHITPLLQKWCKVILNLPIDWLSRDFSINLTAKAITIEVVTPGRCGDSDDSNWYDIPLEYFAAPDKDYYIAEEVTRRKEHAAQKAAQAAEQESNRQREARRLQYAKLKQEFDSAGRTTG